MSAENYGRFYWCIGVPRSVSRTGKIYANACRVETRDGVLELWADTRMKDGQSEPRDPPLQVLSLARGAWLYCFAASVWDGHPVAVEHWPEEIGQEDENAAPSGERQTTPEQSRKERDRMNQAVRYRVMKRDNFTCAACNRKPSEHGVVLEVDHIVPISRGGRTDDLNLRTLCRECNRSKSDQPA